MILKGFKFGMLLQLAVGPISLLVFNTATTYGFLSGLPLIVAITLIDALYIALSSFGVAAIINQPRVKAIIKVIGCLVLILFGANTIASAFNVSFLPDIALFTNVSNENLFVQGLLLTASNPLTIIFWGGMFSTQMIEHAWDRKQLFLFAIGCLMATLFFLTLVAYIGSVLSGFLPQEIVQLLNIAVGVILIVFGIRLLMKKEHVALRNDGALS